jgi:hypothetical protein
MKCESLHYPSSASTVFNHTCVKNAIRFICQLSPIFPVLREMADGDPLYRRVF